MSSTYSGKPLVGTLREIYLLKVKRSSSVLGPQLGCDAASPQSSRTPFCRTNLALQRFLELC